MERGHPLENPSLAPYGFVFPLQRGRLDYRPQANASWINEEKVMARLWDRCNRANAPRPLPVQTIVHEILPSQASASRITNGDFWYEGLPYLARDILVLSSTLQWFGTNGGRCFLETDVSRFSIPGFHPGREFRIKLARKMRKRDMVAFWTHVCTPRCESGHRHCCDSRAVLPRDRAVVDGLMFWLDRNAGRAFLAEFALRKRNKWNAANERRRNKEAAGVRITLVA